MRGGPLGIGIGIASQRPRPAALALDNIESAVLAHSVAFKLRTDYTGSAIRVRRSSDDTEQDIGFAGNALDTASLESFAGAGDAYITKVYEQSGHAAAVDYAQTTADLQPQIVASGTTITKDGKVAMRQPTSGVGSEHIILDSWSTRPASAQIVRVVSIPAARDVVIWSTSDNLVLSGVVIDGDSSTAIARGSGSPAYYKNAALVGTQGDGLTRDEMHTAFSVDALLIERESGIDLSNSAWATARTEYTLNDSTDGPEYWSEEVVITDTAEVAALESNIAAAYGISI